MTRAWFVPSILPTTLLLPIWLAACIPSEADHHAHGDTADADTDSDTDTDADSDTDSDADTDSDPGTSPLTLQVREDWWNASAACWETRDLWRDPSDWEPGWAEPGTGCYETYEATCVNEDGDPVFDDPECPKAYTSQASEDGLCTRWPWRYPDEDYCLITDPWVLPCSTIAGCCDEDRANLGPTCD